MAILCPLLFLWAERLEKVTPKNEPASKTEIKEASVEVFSTGKSDEERLRTGLKRKGYARDKIGWVKLLDCQKIGGSSSGTPRWNCKVMFELKLSS